MNKAGDSDLGEGFVVSHSGSLDGKRDQNSVRTILENSDVVIAVVNKCLFKCISFTGILPLHVGYTAVKSFLSRGDHPRAHECGRRVLAEGCTRG